VNVFELGFCKMEIGLISFKEIGCGTSLNNLLNRLRVKHLPFQKERAKRRFCLLKVSFLSILQNSAVNSREAERSYKARAQSPV
jgi:hypothetical protein